MWSLFNLLCLLAVLSFHGIISQSICDNCNCDEDSISCYGVDLTRALGFPVPRNIAERTTSLQLGFCVDTEFNIYNDTLSRFCHLQELSISYCTVKFMSDSAFEGLDKLSYIYMELTHLTAIPNTVLSTVGRSLTELHFAYQYFKNVSAVSFKGLVSLQKLSITRNSRYLMLAPDAFNSLSNLTHLSLSTSHIERLSENAFLPLLRVQELDLSYNLLRKIPTAINSLHSLQVLDLSHNSYLTDIRELRFLQGMPGLQSLQLGYCNISYVTPTAVSTLLASKISTANFDGNPFRCVPKLCDFILWHLNSTRPVVTTTRSPFYIPFITLSPPPGKGPYRCRTGESFADIYDTLCLPPPITYPISTPVEHDLGSSSLPIYVVIIVVVFVLGLFVVATAFFLLWRFKRGPSHQRLFIRGRIRSEEDDDDDEHQYLFDAYVCHHDEDRQFVEEEMLPRLEEEEGFGLCVSFRNFRLGSNRLENVTSALDVSRVAIFVINERFMQNGQCKLELEMFSTRMLEDERGVRQVGGGRQRPPRLILILMEPIPEDVVNTTLRLLLSHMTYLEWDPDAVGRCWGQLVATLRALIPLRGADENNQGDDEDEENVDAEEEIN